jgi:Domain of unknown function (DUF4157)
MGFERRHRDGVSPREEYAEALARAHRLELEHARELLRRAEQAAAEDPQARPVREWFALLIEEGTRGGRAGSGARGARDPQARVPGRQTLVMREADDDAAAALLAPVPAHAAAARRPEPGRLDLATQWRMSQAFGFDFSGVSIRRDSPLATGATRAVVQDGEVHFRAGAYQPGTRAGDWLIAHELAHVVQQQGGRGDQPASRRAIEREADRAATLAVHGRPAPIALRAQPAAAYAFSDGEDHAEPAAEAVAEAPAADGVEAATGVGAEAATGESVEESAGAEGGPAAADAEPAAAAAADAEPAAAASEAEPAAAASEAEPAAAASEAEPAGAVPAAHDGDERHAHVEGMAADAAEDEALEADAADAHEEPASAHDPVAPEIAAPGGAAPDSSHGAAPGGAAPGGAAPGGAAPGGAAPDAAADAAPDSSHGDKQEEEAEEGEGEAAAGAGEGGYDPRSELAMAPVPGEGGGAPGGALGGGGGAPPKPQKAAPAVAGAPPEAGFTQLQGVRPDKLVPALGQVRGAATADVGKKRAEAKANPPKQMSNGDGAAAKGAPGAPGAKGADASAPGGDKKAAGAGDKAEQPVKGEVPGGQAAKQAQQGQAKQEQQQAGAPIAAAAQERVWWLQAFSGKPPGGAPAKSGKDGGEPAMSDAEKQQMSSSLASLPTKANVSTDPGAAPEIAMKGEAKANSGQDRAKLEAKAAQLESQGRTDSRVPLGEDSIETSVPTEELTAKSVPGGGSPGDASPGGASHNVALPTVAGAAPSEEVAIVAQEQNGAQIDAALAKASADVATERAKHAQEDQKARAEADKQIRDLKTKADADQAAARAAAKSESEKARGEWQAEIDKKGADARKQADKKVSEGMAQVEAEEAKANAEAKQHVEEGKRKADEEKQKGEQEAERAKEQGKEKSSGFFGWLSSKAKAFFDGIKKAVSAVIDAARKAVKAVLDAAKKLAMAAIELARKAITAAIKAIGEALIAITDVLLAAFPELKAKFQAAIRAAVNKAVETVNKLAEGLKKAVQAALDLLGKALDAALSLLEKGLHALVDVVADVVQGYIDAAKAIVDALGEWVKIIKDVAKGPGAWIGKLGAAVVDGIKNHLWSAFKTAVVEWFKSKVVEVLGVAGMILQVLLEGGITMDDIVKMAMDALIIAIPMALVAILIEKLVAMIVPAAGALMAIIEGLQAAWGTISRIIAAFSAFMAFLSAVQGGGAGPLFATALASAAVVVLDFVANWLLRKLRGPAAKVGRKLEGIAAKLKLKGKGKGKPGSKPGSKPKRADADGPGAGPAKSKPKQHADADGPGAGPAKGKPKRKPDDADGPNGTGGKPKQKPDQGKGKGKGKGKDKDKKKSDRDKDKKDKKEQQDKKDQALVERAARQAAAAGWRHAKTESGARVRSQAEVESAAQRAARGPAGVRVHVDVVGSGGSWRVQAKATKGSHTATSTAGNGTTLRAKTGSTWYASKSLRSVHQQILSDAARQLKQPDATKPKDLQAAYSAKQALARQLETKGQAKIDSHIHGIKFDIKLEPFSGVKDDRKIKTELLISPNWEELEINVPATTEDTFKELVERLQKEVMSKNPYHNQDVILAGCEQIATAVGAKWTTVAKGGGGGKELIVKFTANDAAGKQKTYVCSIVQTKADDRCASCGKNKGEIEPHNVVSQELWKDAVNDTLAALGLPTSPVSPLQLHITGVLRGRSAAFGDAQKQCPHCEAPGSVAKTGVAHHGDGRSLSLIQRSKLPNAGTDGSIVGEQFGGTKATPKQLEATTAAHVKKVMSGLGRELTNVKRTYAGDPVAAICDAQQAAFVATLETIVRAKAR